MTSTARVCTQSPGGRVEHLQAAGREDGVRAVQEAGELEPGASVQHGRRGRPHAAGGVVDVSRRLDDVQVIEAPGSDDVVRAGAVSKAGGLQIGRL